MEQLPFRGKRRCPVVANAVTSAAVMVCLLSAGAFSSAQRLWPSIEVPVSGLVEAVDLAGSADLIEWRPGVLLRRDGQTGVPVWVRELSAGPRGDADAAGPNQPPWDVLQSDPPSAELLRPAPDLDGDGIGDLVWLSRRAPCVLALSGGSRRKGGRIWAYTAAPGTSGARESARPGPRQPLEGRVVGTPALMEIDDDGVPDLIATFAANDSGVTSGIAGWIEAISGRSGRPLWRYSLRDVQASVDRLPAALISLQGRPIITFFDGFERFTLDAATGQPGKTRFHHGILPVRPPQYVDVDGDGEPEMLVVSATRMGGQELAVHHLIPPFGFWELSIHGSSTDPAVLANPRLPWPVVVDLDPKEPGRDLLLPDAENKGLRVVNGTNGRTRWERPLRTEAESNNPSPMVIDGPDLDGDGIRDVFAASFFWNQHKRFMWALARRDPAGVYVEAFSGRDGRRLWWWHHPLRETSATFAHLQWWQSGPDGWPLLVVSIGHAQSPLAPDDRAMVFLLTAGTGHLAKTIDGLSWPSLADFDDDGGDDLWGTIGGKVDVFHGGAPTPRNPSPAPAARTSGPNLADPRFWRPLPWVPVGGGQIPFAATLAILALLVWVLPVRLVRRALRNAPCKRALWKALPVAIAIIAATYLVLPADRVHGYFQGVGAYEVLLAVTILLPAVILAGWMLYTRHIQLPKRLSQVMALAFAVALVEAAYLTSVLAEPTNRPAAGRLGVIGFLGIAALGVPIVVLGEALGGTIRRRDWRRIAWLLGLVLFLTLAIALAMLLADLRNPGRSEPYAWDGWYTLVYPAAYSAGVVLLVVNVFKSYRRWGAEAIGTGQGKGKSKLDELAEI